VSYRYLQAVEHHNDSEVHSTISLFHPLLGVKLSGVRSGREGEVKGNLTPCVVAAREWRVNSLVDQNITRIDYDQSANRKDWNNCR